MRGDKYITKKNKKIILICTLATFTIIIFMAYIFKYYHFTFIVFNERTQLSQEFVYIVHDNILPYGMINFDTITNFEWDSRLVIGPYANPRQFFYKEGLMWGRMVT